MKILVVGLSLCLSLNALAYSSFSNRSSFSSSRSFSSYRPSSYSSSRSYSSSFRASPSRTSTSFKGLSNVKPINYNYKPAPMSSFKSYNPIHSRPPMVYHNNFYHSSTPNFLGYYLIFSMMHSHNVNNYPSCRCEKDKPVDCPKEVECKKKDW